MSPNDSQKLIQTLSIPSPLHISLVPGCRAPSNPWQPALLHLTIWPLATSTFASPSCISCASDSSCVGLRRCSWSICNPSDYVFERLLWWHCSTVLICTRFFTWDLGPLSHLGGPGPQVGSHSPSRTSSTSSGPANDFLLSVKCWPV